MQMNLFQLTPNKLLTIGPLILMMTNFWTNCEITWFFCGIYQVFLFFCGKYLAIYILNFEVEFTSFFYSFAVDIKIFQLLFLLSLIILIVKWLDSYAVDIKFFELLFLLHFFKIQESSMKVAFRKPLLLDYSQKKLSYVAICCVCSLA